MEYLLLIVYSPISSLCCIRMHVKSILVLDNRCMIGLAAPLGDRDVCYSLVQSSITIGIRFRLAAILDYASGGIRYYSMCLRTPIRICRRCCGGGVAGFL